MCRIAVWATIDKAADISDGQSSEKYGNYVVYDIHPQDYEDLDGAYYSNIYTRDVNRFEQSDYDTDDLMMYSDQVDIDICFQNDDNITTVTRESSTKDESTANVIVKAYNFYTDNYDVIFVNGSQEIEGDRLAPYIENNDDNVEVLTIVDNNIVAAKENNLLVTSFLPELTSDYRVHKYFLKMVENNRKA